MPARSAIAVLVPPQNLGLIYQRTGNLRAVQRLLGHSKIESTIRYFGVEVGDAIELAEKIEN